MKLQVFLLALASVWVMGIFGLLHILAYLLYE